MHQAAVRLNASNACQKRTFIRGKMIAYMMKIWIILLLACVTVFFQSDQKTRMVPDSRFNMEKDLLVANYDCKTDVDDLHSVAALRSLLSMPEYRNVRYRAVAGTYGMQEGKYVPPNTLFQLAFGNHWSDAHASIQKAIDEVAPLVTETLRDGGDVWIAEAGQSDFTAELIRSVLEALPGQDISGSIHVVQHSDWNEEVTTPESLDFVQAKADYIKIPDGNGKGNGTPGFRSDKPVNWKSRISDPDLREVWQLAIDIGNRYNGADGRYQNEAIAGGGLDFSDFSEVWWIFGLPEMYDAPDFFTFLAP